MPCIHWYGQSVFYLEAAPPHHDRTLLCIHGAGGNSRHWAYQLSLAGELNSRIIAVDLPGHGRSEGRALTTIKEYSSFIQDLTRLLEIERVSLLGHSMGSAVALTVAAGNPALVESLVLIGTCKQFRVAPWLLDSLKKGERPVSFVEMAYHRQADPRILTSAKEEFARIPVEVLLTDFLACQAFDFEHREPGLNVNCLLLFGEQDRLTPVQYVQSLAALLPNHRLTVIPKAGHMVMFEQPDATNQAIYSFLS